MTNYSISQLIQLVRTYHPTAGANPVVPAVAICLAESGGDSTAVSPSDDWGLWQINRHYHFGDGIINQGNWQNPAVQVAEMWKLSAGGTNWGAWCTAYAPFYQNRCGSFYLPSPQPDSPAANNMDMVQQVWNRIHGTPPPGANVPPIPPSEQLSPQESRDYAVIKNYLGSEYYAQWIKLVGAERAIKGVVT